MKFTITVCHMSQFLVSAAAKLMNTVSALQSEEIREILTGSDILFTQMWREW